MTRTLTARLATPTGVIEAEVTMQGNIALYEQAQYVWDCTRKSFIPVPVVAEPVYEYKAPAERVLAVQSHGQGQVRRDPIHFGTFVVGETVLLTSGNSGKPKPAVDKADVKAPDLKESELIKYRTSKQLVEDNGKLGVQLVTETSANDFWYTTKVHPLNGGGQALVSVIDGEAQMTHIPEEEEVWLLEEIVEEDTPDEQ